MVYNSDMGKDTNIEYIIDAKLDEVKRHFDVVAEDLRSQIQSVEESILAYKWRIGKCDIMDPYQRYYFLHHKQACPSSWYPGGKVNL